MACQRLQDCSTAFTGPPPAAGPDVSRAMLRSSTLTRGSPKKPNCLPSTCCGQDFAHPGLGHAARPGDPRNLELGIRRRDVRVEPRRRCGDHVGRDLPLHCPVLCHHLGHRPGHERIGELAVGGPLVGGARRAGVVPGAGSGGTRMEVPSLGERLADECAADHLPVHRHQRTVRLPREEELRQPGHHPGVEHAGDQAEQQGQDDRRTQLLPKHGYTSLSRTRERSISLMPANGTTMPPSP